MLNYYSTPDQQQLITDKMRDRRMKLHERYVCVSVSMCIYVCTWAYMHAYTKNICYLCSISLNTAVDDEGWEVTDVGVMDSVKQPIPALDCIMTFQCLLSFRSMIQH